MTRAIFALLAFTFTFAIGCKKDEPPKNAPLHSAGLEIKPIYADFKGPIDPLAEKLCDALDTLPAQRRAECCNKKNAGFTSATLCKTTLSSALASKHIVVTASAAEACASAMAASHQGCEWVGPWGLPLPAACSSLIRGTISSGQACRSSLECTAPLRCIGVGPTDPGVCGPAQEDNTPCGTAVDTLATYTRQDKLDVQHPECKGACVRHRCLPRANAGEECESSTGCMPGLICAGGRCSTDAAAGEGEPCGARPCIETARCVHGTCVLPKPAGASCETGLECKAGCSNGRCAMQCL